MNNDCKNCHVEALLKTDIAWLRSSISEAKAAMEERLHAGNNLKHEFGDKIRQIEIEMARLEGKASRTAMNTAAITAILVGIIVSVVSRLIKL